MTYTPKGKIVPFIQAMRNDPQRIWTIVEIAKVMGLRRSNNVGGSLLYAERAGLVFRGRRKGLLVFRGVAFEQGAVPTPQPKEKLSRRVKINAEWTTTPDHVRVPKVVPGWNPPQMVAPRA